MRQRTYGEMSLFESYLDRFNYLRLDGEVGNATFGSDRYLNQHFYKSREWKQLREMIIARDEGYDLAHPDYPIGGRILVHHINPLTAKEVEHGGEGLLDPNNLICVSHDTHNAIHFGDARLLRKEYVERKPGDTLLW